MNNEDVNKVEKSLFQVKEKGKQKNVLLILMKILWRK